MIFGYWDPQGIASKLFGSEMCEGIAGGVGWLRPCWWEYLSYTLEEPRSGQWNLAALSWALYI